MKGLVPAERVLPLLRWLVARFGRHGTSLRSGVSEFPIYSLLRGDQSRVSKRVAQGFVRAVLAAQPADREHRARPPTLWEQERSRREGIRLDRSAYRRGEKKPPQLETPVGAHDKNLCQCGKPKGIAAKRCYACFRADESKAFQKASRGRARLTGKQPARSLESPRMLA